MAKKELFLHVVTVGNSKYGVDQPDDYANIGSIVGVTKAAESGNNTIEVFNTVSELQRAGKVIRLACHLKNRKTNTVLCAIDKVASAIGKLRGQSLANSTISSVTIPRKRSRR